MYDLVGREARVAELREKFVEAERLYYKYRGEMLALEWALEELEGEV
jgi:hypothetical protein